jgi:putative aldouronate transport system substrate-binding protein
MTKRTKRITVLACVAALLIVLVACSGGNKSDGGTASPTSTAGGGGGSSASAGGQAGTNEKPDPFGKMPVLVEFTTGLALPAENKFPQGESFENNDVQKWFKENLNITPKVEWTTAIQNYAFEEKINLLIAANSIPDVLSISVEPYGLDILNKLVRSGMVEDLTDDFELYASDFLKESYAMGGTKALDAVTFDGRLYALPTVADVESAVAVIWTRKDWLDELGLEEPQTLDDVERLVRIFKEKKNAGPLPSQQNIYGVDTASFDFVFAAYDAYPGTWIEADDGTIVYGSVQPQVKDALARLARWYQDGIIPKDFMLMEGYQAVESVVNGTAGIFQGAWWSHWWPLMDSVKNDPNADWTAIVLKGEDGVAHGRGFGIIRSYVVVKKGFKYPEAIIKAANVSVEATMNRLDWYNALRYNDGAKYRDINIELLPVPVSAKDPFEITNRYKDIMLVLEGKKSYEEADPQTKAQVDAYRQLQEAEDKLADMGLWALGNQFVVGAAGLVKNELDLTLPAFIGTTDLMQKKKATLDDLEKRTFLEIITGAKPVDEFDNFVAQWRSMGGDEITAEVNEIAGR